MDSALAIPDLTDYSKPGSEDLPMGNRISGRSLQDDAFGAEESVDRRSRVMGDEFAEHFEDASIDPHAEEDSEPERKPIRPKTRFECT